MDADAWVTNEYRDSVFHRLTLIQENQSCFECGGPRPIWTSVNLGIFICYNCTTKHRNMGTHLSFVRSSDYDKWNLRQLAKIEAGGNKRAKEFFRQHGFAGTVDFASSAAERWRHELTSRVEAVYPVIAQASTESPKPKIPVAEVTRVEAKAEVKPMLEEVKVPEIKPIISSKPLYVPPTTSGATHRFRKGKTDDKPVTGFKAVSFRPEQEPVELPVATKPRPQKPLPAVEPLPMPMERKPVEKKAFSSDDFEAMHQDSSEVKAKISQFKGSASISSDDYFGRTPLDQESSDSFKDEAMRYAEGVASRASEVRTRQVKNAAVRAWHQLQDRFK